MHRRLVGPWDTEGDSSALILRLGSTDKCWDRIAWIRMCKPFGCDEWMWQADIVNLERGVGNSYLHFGKVDFTSDRREQLEKYKLAVEKKLSEMGYILPAKE